MVSNSLRKKSPEYSCNQRARELTSSYFQRPSSYLYHLIRPSSFLVRWHMMHESSMHLTNLCNRAAFCRMVSSSSLMILPSIRRQCDILSTSRFCKPSSIRIRASLFSIAHLRLSTFKFGR